MLLQHWNRDRVNSCYRPTKLDLSYAFYESFLARREPSVNQHVADSVLQTVHRSPQSIALHTCCVVATNAVPRLIFLSAACTLYNTTDKGTRINILEKCARPAPALMDTEAQCQGLRPKEDRNYSDPERSPKIPSHTLLRRGVERFWFAYQSFAIRTSGRHSN